MLTLDGAVVARLEAESARPLQILRDLAGANFDDEPVLIINLASIASFALEAGMEIDHRRFRANLYLEGIEPQEEIGGSGDVSGQATPSSRSSADACAAW